MIDSGSTYTRYKRIRCGIFLLTTMFWSILSSCGSDKISVRPTRLVTHALIKQPSDEVLHSIRKAEMLDDSTLVVLDGLTTKLHFVNIKSGELYKSMRQLEEYHRISHESVADSLVWQGIVHKRGSLRSAGSMTISLNGYELFEGIHDFHISSPTRMTTLTYSRMPYVSSANGSVLLFYVVALVEVDLPTQQIISFRYLPDVNEDIFPIPSAFCQLASGDTWISAWPGNSTSDARTRAAKFLHSGKYAGVVSSDPLGALTSAHVFDRQGMRSSQRYRHFYRVLSNARGIDAVDALNGSVRRTNLPEVITTQTVNHSFGLSHLVRVSDSELAYGVLQLDSSRKPHRTFVSTFNEADFDSGGVSHSRVLLWSSSRTLKGLVSTSESIIWRGKLLCLTEDEDEAIRLEEVTSD